MSGALQQMTHHDVCPPCPLCRAVCWFPYGHNQFATSLFAYLAASEWRTIPQCTQGGEPQGTAWCSRTAFSPTVGPTLQVSLHQEGMRDD